MLKKTLLVGSITFLYSIQADAQESVNSSGKTETTNAGEISYSIGQVVDVYSTNSNGSVQSGVQQTYTVQNSARVEALTKFNINVFPNPTTDFINIQLDNVNGDEFTVQIIDNSGKIVHENKFNTTNEQLSFAEFASGSYTLNLMNKNNKNTYTIIKNK